ncbi:hypothetical protein OG911_28055 [Streptomyces sp. NBC_00208]|uniref:hypothetical protein n=1 Tax=Streptomyces sp. NBC_00208 TaxID=2975681 RepID=UPI002E2DD8E4|nr:hypothetical protein [Streptomyces sp. NBC_00208]
MRTYTAIAAAVITLLALTGCSSDTKADPAACKAVLAKQLAEAVAAGDKAKQGKRPPACNGVDDKTLERIAGELATEQAGKAVEDAIESAAPEATTVPISDECHAWIKAELLDTSDDIDAAAGSAVCGDLSDAEMDQAIEDVTNELTATP